MFENNNMKILIYGPKGWIGNQFVELLTKEGITFHCGSSRTDNEIDLTREIDEIQPTHVVSFIGRTHGKIGDKVYSTIDYLEEEGKLVENIRDNLFSPLLLAHSCAERKIHYTYLGTGCIFKFDEEHPFAQEKNGFHENSLPNFFGSSYSVVKGFTDRFMHLYKDSVLNLRIRMPITGEKNTRNFITKITSYERVCSVPNSMSVLPELLPYVLSMMREKTTGTMNLTNPGLISHNEILEMYREIVDPNFTWKNFSQEEQRQILAADRSNNYLDTTSLQTLFPEILDIRDSVRNCLLKYSESANLSSLLAPTQVREYKNILITGGCGFIGSNFINYYFSKNDEFTKLVNLDAIYYCANVKNVEKWIRNHKKYKFIKGNLCDSRLITQILEKYNITHIIHFAAQSHVQNSFEDSIKFTNDNIVGTHTLLECCRKFGRLQKIVHVSTDEVYGESMNTIEETHKTEHSVLCPTNPYAATKAGAELIAQSYNHSYKMPIIITRGNNVYGRNQYPEKLIPRFIKLLNENKKVTIQGKGTTVRAFLHAYDTAKAFETILEIYNIGCDEGMEYSVMDIAKILIRMIKKTENYEEWIEYVEDRPYNDERYYISNQKVKDLGWNIEIDLNMGLTDLIYENKYKMNLISLVLTENDENKANFFGDWKNDLTSLREKFQNAEPFGNVVIPNFLNSEFAELLYNEFPENTEDWHFYNNPIEVKYAYDDIKNLPKNLKKIFYLLSTKEITKIISKISGIEDIEFDPYLHGAGLHVHPRNGRLHMHLDYEKHPFSQKERRLNIILYLSKDWDPEWNGETQLWNQDVTECVVKSPVVFNTAFLFTTDSNSWHGLPEKISCPPNIFRKTLAYYYVSPLTSIPDTQKKGCDESGYRLKAYYTKRPNDTVDERINEFYSIRPYRLITENDKNKIWKEWNAEEN
jgi:3,5-epimerase/4-reductase